MSDKKTLDVREQRFAELVADHTDRRGIIAKAEDAGYTNGRSGYTVIARERVTREIERITEANMRPVRARRARVLEVLANRAETENEAARLFLQACGVIGSGGNTTQVNVAQTSGGDFADRLTGAYRADTLAGVSQDEE